MVGDTELGPGCPQMVKVMELLLFRETADRLVTYRKLIRTPKEYCTLAKSGSLQKDPSTSRHQA